MSQAMNRGSAPPLSSTPEAAILRQIFRFIFGNLVILIAGLAVGAGLGLLAQKHLPVTYEADGSFIVDEPPFLQKAAENSSIDGTTASELVQSLILGIPSLNMRDAVAARLNVPATNICFEDISPRPLSLRGQTAVANIRVSSVHGSRTGNITVQSQSAEFAAATVNALLDELLKYNQALGQLTALNLTLQFAAAQAANLQVQAGTLEQNRGLQEQQVAQLDEYLKQGLPLESFPTFATDITLNNLKTQRLLAQADYASLATSSPGGLRLESKKAELERIEKEIDQQARTLAAGLRSQLVATQTQEKDLQAELDATQQKIQAVSHERANWVQSFGNIATMETLIAGQTNHLAFPGSAIVVVNRGVPADRPQSPKLVLNLGVGIFVGGLAGLVVAVMATLLNDRLTSPESVTSLTGLPCVATIPRPWLFFGRRKNLSATVLNPAGFDPLRSRLLLSPAGGKIQVIGFTPARRGERASQLVARLAVMLARAGRRVLVVDLHFTSPRQAVLLGIKPAHTLVEWMGSTDALGNFVATGGLTGLGLLTCGSGKNTARELSARRPLAAVLPELQDSWDFVLIDSPAIASCWDLALALPAESGLVITANRGQARARQVLQTVDRAQSQQWRVLGVALQRCPQSQVS